MGRGAATGLTPHEGGMTTRSRHRHGGGREEARVIVPTLIRRRGQTRDVLGAALARRRRAGTVRHEAWLPLGGPNPRGELLVVEAAAETGLARLA